MREQQTIVISSHHVEEIEDLLEDVVVLDRGRVLAAGSVDEVRSGHSPDPVTADSPLPGLTDVLVDLTEEARV